ncbi:MAG: ComF family protein [Treponema sp.]|nr:ComF family protein [Treponema sp.]
MNIFYKILFWGKNFLFPSECAVCGGSLLGIEEIKYSLCDECTASIKQIPGSKCCICGKPLISEIHTCLSCRNSEGRSYDRLWVLFPYAGKYRKLLAKYKFSKNLSLADFFAKEIINVLEDDVKLKEAIIVPVPPRKGKIKSSGWDQIDYLLKRLKKLSKGLIIRRCLMRKKSKVQKELNRAERLSNLKGKIYLREPPPKTVLIIDDVITTGSTMEVCAEVLKQGGAEKVYGLTIFYD